MLDDNALEDVTTFAALAGLRQYVLMDFHTSWKEPFKEILMPGIILPDCVI